MIKDRLEEVEQAIGNTLTPIELKNLFEWLDSVRFLNKDGREALGLLIDKSLGGVEDELA